MDSIVLNSSVDRYLADIEDLRSRYAQGNGAKIREALQVAIREINQDAAEQFQKLEVGERKAAREASSTAFIQAITDLEPYRNNYQDTNFNPRQFLNHYAEGYSKYVGGGCGPRILPDGTLVPHVDWEGQDMKGEQGCPALAQIDQRVQDMVSGSFAETAATSEATSDYFYGNGGMSPNTMRRFEELDPYRTYYASAWLNAGYFRDMGHRLPKPFQESGPLMEGGISYMGGSDKNLGSHRLLFATAAGWEQHIYHYGVLFPKVGLGVAENWLDFGKGFPLEEETSLMGHLEINAGGEVDLGTAGSWIVSLGYFGERTLLGEPKYNNHGFKADVTFRINRLSRNPPATYKPETPDEDY